MELIKGIEQADLALFLPKTKIVVLADIHIGYEEALNKQGVLVPRFQFKEVMQHLIKIIEKTKPKSVIVNGDIKHEFGRISDQEWTDTLKIIDYLSKNCEKVILIKGNHDTILGPIARLRNVEIRDHMLIDDIYICHGHKIPENAEFRKAKTIIIGHEHPAISISDFARSETYKCFLVGKWKRKKLIVMPSFNFVAEGTDILQEQLLSPFLNDISNFEVYVVADKVYNFGKIKK